MEQGVTPDQDALLAQADALVEEAWLAYENAECGEASRFAWDVLMVAVSVYADLAGY